MPDPEKSRCFFPLHRTSLFLTSESITLLAVYRCTNHWSSCHMICVCQLPLTDRLEREGYSSLYSDEEQRTHDKALMNNHSHTKLLIVPIIYSYPASVVIVHGLDKSHLTIVNSNLVNCNSHTPHHTQLNAFDALSAAKCFFSCVVARYRLNQ